MIRYFTLLLFIGLAWGQNPCEDERYLELKTKSLDVMSDREYQYFLNYDEKCSQYQKSQTIIEPNESNLSSNTNTVNNSAVMDNFYNDGFERAKRSYSGEGAYMSPYQGTVIAPQQWFGRKNKQHMNDLYVKDWTVIT